MALSGTLSKQAGGVLMTLSWTATQNRLGYSDVAWALTAQRTNSDATNTIYDIYCTLEDASGSKASQSMPLVYVDYTVLSGTQRVWHTAKGTRTFTASFQASTLGSGATLNLKNSGSFTLDKIDMATTPSAPSSADMGSTITISLPRVLNAHTHEVSYTFGGYYAVIASSATTSCSWAIPVNLAQYIPNAYSAVGTITCKTYNGSTLVGTKTTNITLNVSSSTVPSITNVSLTETGTSLGVWTAGYSQAEVDITASGIYGSTIRSYVTTIDGVTYSTDEFTTEVFATSGQKTVEVTVTDTRGKTATYTTTITVLAYVEPKINSFTAYRCDASGNESEDGTRVKVIYNYETTPLNNQNQISLTIGTEDITIIDVSPVPYSQSTYIISDAVFAIEHSYVITMTVTDEFKSNSAKVDIPTDKVVFDIYNDGAGFAFGKVAETTDLLDVNFNAKFRKNVEFLHDTNGWVNLTLTSDFVAYDNDNVPQYKVKNNIVQLRGVISPATAHATSATRETFATLPSTYAPSKDINVICQGSNKATWLLTICSNGALTFSRYGTTSYDTVPTSAWLVIHAVFMCD